MSSTKLEKALFEAFIEVYKVSEPPADFNELVVVAPLNERGQKDIPFNDYQCDESKMRDILKTVAEKYKLNKQDIRNLEINFWLGCSPRTKINS
jgi:hypothetical protein